MASSKMVILISINLLHTPQQETFDPLSRRIDVPHGVYAPCFDHGVLSSAGWFRLP
ncbi:hypothetical protein MPTK2_2g22590 [Marchantia polymorpha subsp. ruderalis]